MLHASAVVSTVAVTHSVKVLGACSPMSVWVPSGCSAFLPPSNDMHLGLGSLSVCECLSLYVSPVISSFLCFVFYVQTFYNLKLFFKNYVNIPVN